MNINLAQKVCPKCQPHLASPAGVKSGLHRTSVSHEPCFTRKRKVPQDDYNRKVADHAPQRISAAEDTHFRSSHRGVSMNHPTTYQMNYAWRDPASIAPLIRADTNINIPIAKRSTSYPSKQKHLLSVNSGKHSNELSSEPKKHSSELLYHSKPPSEHKYLSKPPSKLKLSNELSSKPKQHDKVASEHKHRPSDPKETSHKDKSKSKRLLPLSTSNEEQHVSIQPKGNSTKARLGVLEPKQSSNSPSKGSVMKKKKQKRIPPSALKKLYASDYKRYHTAKGVFETEYRRHYKDWLGKSWAAARGSANQENAPPTTSGSSMPNAPTDYRLLRHSSQPPVPRKPSITHWKSMYTTEFMEPNLYSYEQGAWRAPHSMGEPKDGKGGAGDEHPWFRQVVELRHNAERNKWKQQRTNFHPNHYVSYDPYEEKLMMDDYLSEDVTSPSANSPVSSSSSQTDDHDTSPCLPLEKDPKPALKQRPNTASLHLNIPSAKDDLIVEDIEETENIADSTSHLAGLVNDEVSRKMISRGKSKPSSLPVTDVECTCAANSRDPVYKPKPSPSSPHVTVISPEKSDMKSEVTVTSPDVESPDEESHDVKSEVTVTAPDEESHDTKRDAPPSSLPDHTSGNKQLSSKEKLLNNSFPNQETCPPVKGSTVHVPKHAFSSSPYYAYCAKTSVDNKPPNHVRKLMFDGGPVSSKTSKIYSLSNSIPPGKHEILYNSSSSVPRINSTVPCKICGADLQARHFQYDIPSQNKTLSREEDFRNGPSFDEYESNSTLQKLRLAQLESKKKLESIRARQAELAKRKKSCPTSSLRSVVYTDKSASSRTKSGEVSNTKPVGDVDELSLSTMSISSCSVASEILEKAKKRRDSFWTGSMTHK